MRSNRRMKNALTWGYLEALESRTLLSGLPLSAGLTSTTSSEAAVIPVNPIPVAPANPGLLLTAQLSSASSTPTATVQFAQNTGNGGTNTCVCVEVQGAPANDSVNVSLDGVVVGSVTTNAQGGGVLALASNPQGPQLALPANFPTGVQSGTAVSLSDSSGAVELSGTLAAVPANPNPPAQPPAASATVLNAQLTAMGSMVTASFQFTQATEGGTTYTLLAVRVFGAPGGDTISVTVDGVSVGQITTGPNGSGGLLLSSNPQGQQQALPADFPTSVVAGTTVSVSDSSTLSLSGTLVNLPPAPTGALLTAQLTGTGSTATASVQLEQYTANASTNTLFAVQVQGATASDTLTVTLAGVAVGQVTTDVNGNGMLVLSSNPQGNQLALPANFPTSVASGAAVSVTDASTLSLTGMLASPPKQVPPGPPIPPPSAPAPHATVLVSKLTGTGTSATSLVQFTQDSFNSTTYTLLSVQVHGAPANDTLMVTLLGTALAEQFTTDANGNGQLILSSNPQGTQQALPANFPTNVASGGAVSITDNESIPLSLTGTLAAPNPGSIGTILTAQLTGVGTSATATIQFMQFNINGTPMTVLAVQVQGAPASDTLTLALSGFTSAVGTITTNANGNGALVLSNNPQGQQQPLPAGFPTGVTSGATFSITDGSGLSLTGNLGALTKPVNPPPPPPPPPPPGSPPPAPNGTILTAQLTGTGTTATASIQLTQDTISGLTYTLLCVQVHGAPASDTLSLNVGGVVLQLTTNSNGNGSAIFSSTPVGPPAGSQQPLPVKFPANVPSGAPVSITDSSSLSLSGMLGNPTPAPLGTLLTVQLTGVGTTATAGVQYAQFTANGTATTLLAVQVQGAPPTDTLTVTLGTFAVGQITTDANGNGLLVLSSNPQGQQQPLPANFPTNVASGATVSITDAGTFSLTGKLATPLKPTQPAPPPPVPVANGTVLIAQLTGTGTSATSSVQFTQDTVNGTTYTSFSVHVSGAPASDTLSVSIGDVVVGQITTDANGNGTLCLSSNPQGQQQAALPAGFPTNVASGSALSVTDANGLDLTGTLAVPAPPAPTPWHNSSNPLDVIGTGGAIVPLDALILIDFLSTQGSGTLPSAQPVGSYDLDVLGNNSVIPQDALKIIDYLSTPQSGSGENSSSTATAVTSAAVSSSVVTPQVTGSTGTVSTTAGPQLAIGAGLTSGSNSAGSASAATLTANSTSGSSQSSATTSSTAVQSSSNSSTVGAAVTTVGTTSGTGSGLNEASIDAVLSDPLFDY